MAADAPLDWTFPVRSHELDAYRHVNQSRYAQWLEEARERWLLSRAGTDYDTLMADGTPLVVRRQELDYRRGARRRDTVTVRTRVESLGRTSLVFHHRVTLGPGDDAPTALEARVVMVCTDPEFRETRPLPDGIVRGAEADGAERTRT